MTSSQPSQEQVRDFVIAGHGSLAKVKEMLAEFPSLLNVAHEWKENDRERAIQGAAHVGNAPIAEYLLEQGAPLEICAAAMLGDMSAVQQFLELTPEMINATGAHGIPLITHAALSGNVSLVQMLFERGAREGISAALISAVNKKHLETIRWLLEYSKPDLDFKDYQGKTALAIAMERGYTDIANVIQKNGVIA